MKLELPDAQAVKILVVGEVILDRYIWGSVDRISPEAPIPVLHVHHSEERIGNAAFVCANLRALDAQVNVASVVGDDANGLVLRRMLEERGIGTGALVIDGSRPTIVKERVLGSVQSAGRGTQQLLRVDNENLQPLSASIEAKVIARLEEELVSVTGVLVSDIDKGLLTSKILRTLIEGARRRNCPIVVDPRRNGDYSLYCGATALTPNRFEAERALGVRLADRAAWTKAARRFIDQFDLSACLISLDREGMIFCERDGEAVHIETTPREVYDVTGAGDVVLAVFGLFLTMGVKGAHAARIANVAAGLEVAKQGAAVIRRPDLVQALQNGHHATLHKVVTLKQLLLNLENHRHARRRICLTNGCFDLLHAGHIQLLEFARSQGDVLVVALNSDSSVRMTKGQGRPVYSVGDRSRILAALEVVDYVVVFDEPRAENIIRQVRPDVLIKGEDWRGKTLDGATYVESYGGQVVLAKLLDGRATSRTIESLQREPSTG